MRPPSSEPAPPARPDRVLDEAAERVGARIRELRRAAGMTLVQLAAASGLSHPFLSQLERGHARASMVSLERIARALGSTQVALLAAAEPARRAPGPTPTEVLRDGEGPSGPYPKGAARLLAPGTPAFEPVEFTGTNRDPGEYYRHPEDEFLYVVRGRILLDLDVEGAHELGPGDSVYYRSGIRHRWSALSPTGYRVLVVKQLPEVPR